LKKKTEKGSLDDLVNSIDMEIENNLRKEYREQMNKYDDKNELDEYLNNN